jgi:replication factor C subunit 2/4
MCSLDHQIRFSDSLAQEIGWTHMRILEGVGTLVQLGGLVARLCKISLDPKLLAV